MAIGSIGEIKDSVVTEPTFVILKSVYNPVDDNMNTRASVGGVDGAIVEYSANGDLVVPPVGTITSMTVTIAEYDAFKHMVIQDYARYFEERINIAVSGP